jgi:phospholipid/cholesterol/gamma-HCH transport system substrate-binding protein
LQALVLGIVVFSGLAVAGVGVFAIGSRQWLWNDAIRLRAGFRDIHGVEVGTRVRVLGREAGAVEAVELPSSPSGEVVLHLKLDGRLRDLVRSDANARIVAEGMVGGKVIEVHPGSDAAEPVADNAVIASRPTTELADVLDQVQGTLQEIDKGSGSLGKLVKDKAAYDELVAILRQARTTLREIDKGQGSLGRLVKDDAAYDELVKLIRQGQGTMVSLKQNADAVKGLPIVRNYVQDPFKELVRPDCACNRQWFHEADLFDPGHAVLTEQGQQRLDNLAPWLDGLKPKGSEVVVASFALPSLGYDLARTLTQKQSEAVCDYLTKHHGVHKTGWFSRRKVIPLGCGTDASPVPEKEPLPAPRVEVLVFVPQG